MTRCKRCGTENPLDFSRGGKSNKGVQPLCKLCTKPKQSLYRKIRKKNNALELKAQGQLFLFEVYL